MKSVKNIKKKLLARNRTQSIAAIVVILVVAAAGAHLFVSSHAQSPYTATSAVSGTLAGGASLQSGSNTSSGNYVDFGGSVPANVLGAFSGYQAANVTGVQAISPLLGHPLTYITTYLDFRNTTNGWTGSTDPTVSEGSNGSITAANNIAYYNNSSFKVVWAVPMLPNTYTSGNTTVSCLTDPTTCWNNGAAGNYNQYFKTVAENLVANNQGGSIIRLGWEFNVPGGWPWSIVSSDGTTQLVSAAQFVQYWQNIVTTMRAVPGAHFIFDWNPSTDNKTTNLQDYYPGNDYVDAIGLDIYNQGWQRCTTFADEKNVWSSFQSQAFGLNWLATYGATNDKPLSFPEWGNTGATTAQTGTGVVSCGDDPYYVQQIAQYIATHNFIEAGIWDYGSNALPGTIANPLPNATAEFINDFK